jgi:hypothetical protein
MTIIDPNAYARHTDPDTSHSAARRLSRSKENTFRIRARIIELIKAHGQMGGEELEARMIHDPFIGDWVTPSGLRTRRAGLVRDGYLRDSGCRNVTSTGSSEIIWELTPETDA